MYRTKHREIAKSHGRVELGMLSDTVPIIITDVNSLNCNNVHRKKEIVNYLSRRKENRKTSFFVRDPTRASGLRV